MKRLIRISFGSIRGLSRSSRKGESGSQSLPSIEKDREAKPAEKQKKARKVFNYVLSHERKRTSFPAFDELKEADILAFSNYSTNLQVASPFRWTPLIQYHDPCREFQQKMREFCLLPTWTEESTGELIDAQIFEALRNTDYDYYYDYECLPSTRCKYHGKIEFLIYNSKNEANRLPIVPVVRARPGFNKEYKINFDDFNIAEVVGVGIWTLENSLSAKKDTQCVRVLQTNGHIWRLYEFGSDGSFRKTGEYVPQNKFKRINQDPETQRIVLGLIRYAAGVQTDGEKKLNEVYSFIEEKKYLTEYDEETRAQISKQKRFWWFLPRRIRDFFF